MFYFDPRYFLFVAPAILLMMWAQYRIRWAYQQGMQIRTRLSGAEAAKQIMESEGLFDVAIEEIGGQLTDHYDPSARVLRLSSAVYTSRSATAVGIAAHEAGHALQHAKGYIPLYLRNAAVPAAQFGPILFMILVGLGFFLQMPQLIWAGLAAYGCIFVFQLVNLPVEIDASNRAKWHLEELGIVNNEGAGAVRAVLNAAAWTYVAATLQALLTLLYYMMRLAPRNR